MNDAARTSDDWAASRRRRWSASRIAAALALHALVLGALKLTIDRVEMPRHADERATTLVTVAIHAAPPPSHALPLPRTRAPIPARADAPAARDAPVPARPREDAAQAITLPAPPPAVAAASSPRPDLSFLDNAATRDAIRNVARGDTVASHANALTHEDAGSELVAADGSHDGSKRNLAIASPAAALSQGVGGAHKADCMKDFGGGLLALPVILAAEAMGKCAHKL